MDGLRKSGNWIAGLQWLFFIFTNIIVIPITIGAAFGLSQGKVVTLIQLSFILTGIACILQGVIGHQRAIMEGQSGLWWGVILTLAASAAAQGSSLSELGGSLATGIIISGFLTILIGAAGLGPVIAKMFNSAVMGVFMFLFGCQLIGIFMKGMLGIPFGTQAGQAHIQVNVSLLSLGIVVLVIVLSVKSPPGMRRYSLLIGILLGWMVYELLFQSNEGMSTGSLSFESFPLGKPSWHVGIIITAVLTGLLNTANTFGAIKGTDEMYLKKVSRQKYRFSFMITGCFTMLSGVLGLVPYAPYVSTVGFLKQTGIIRRLPFLLGGAMFLLMGLLPPIGHFFSMLPLSVGSAVLFVSYLQLLGSTRSFFQDVEFSTTAVYRLAIPLFVGIIIMTMPADYFQSLPSPVRPLVSNGLLVGIVLSLMMENVFHRPSSSHKQVAENKSDQQGQTHHIAK
ncbi:uracil/xanthine transporter [Virgibacillus halophilus]|uniref:uracil/xanthine transporter n=1 Tax=Tigheibacillus halophilus TaxID=361280 RepID=UPI003634A893